MKLIPPVYHEFKEFLGQTEAQAVAEGDSELLADLETIQEWVDLRGVTWFQGKTLEQIQSWMADNLVTDLALLKAEKAIHSSLVKASGAPSESDLEDAYHWVESQLVGSEKQVKWAKSIAHEYHTAIALAWKSGKQVPEKASWWIENRKNIYGVLPL